MTVESPKQEPDDGALAGMHDTLESDQIAFVDALDEEITTVIEQASSLQRYDYVIGTVDGVWTSPENHCHFELIHYNETTEKFAEIDLIERGVQHRTEPEELARVHQSRSFELRQSGNGRAVCR